jgi:hypothetical protein
MEDNNGSAARETLENPPGGSLANIELPGSFHSYRPCSHPGVECQKCKPACVFQSVDDEKRCTLAGHCNCLERRTRCDIYCDCSSQCTLSTRSHLASYSLLASFGIRLITQCGVATDPWLNLFLRLREIRYPTISRL